MNACKFITKNKVPCDRKCYSDYCSLHNQASKRRNKEVTPVIPVHTTKTYKKAPLSDENIQKNEDDEDIIPIIYKDDEKEDKNIQKIY